MAQAPFAADAGEDQPVPAHCLVDQGLAAVWTHREHRWEGLILGEAHEGVRAVVEDLRGLHLPGPGTGIAVVALNLGVGVDGAGQLLPDPGLVAALALLVGIREANPIHRRPLVQGQVEGVDPARRGGEDQVGVRGRRGRLDGHQVRVLADLPGLRVPGVEPLHLLPVRELDEQGAADGRMQDIHLVGVIAGVAQAAIDPARGRLEGGRGGRRHQQGQGQGEGFQGAGVHRASCSGSAR